VAQRWVEKLSEAHGPRLGWTPEAEAAVRWADDKGDRSGRIASQFARHWVGPELLRLRGL
jgi:predicted AAA+ superfamily ATPase